jgi:hypothetical protein
VGWLPVHESQNASLSFITKPTNRPRELAQVSDWPVQFNDKSDQNDKSDRVIRESLSPVTVFVVRDGTCDYAP